MSKQIFIINGSGGSGKDTFVELVSKYVYTQNYSSVTMIKKIAKELGWNGKKTEKDRKFLSDLKQLSSSYNDMPFNYMSTQVYSFKNSDKSFMFLHIREPEEIERAKKEFNAITILIKRDNIKHITSNDADANVFNYDYDIVIENNGTLKDLDKKAQEFAAKYNDKKKTLFIDLDCTFFDTIQTIKKLYDSDYKYYPNYKFIELSKVTSWDFHELNAAEKGQIDLYFNQPRFFENLELMSFADDVIDYYKVSYNIVFVSHGYEPNLKLKEENIKYNFPFAKFIGVNLKDHKDKSCVDMSGEGNIFIDDNVNNLNTSNAPIKICYGDYEWNKDWVSNEKDKYKADTWEDVDDILEIISANN